MVNLPCYFEYPYFTTVTQSVVYKQNIYACNSDTYIYIYSLCLEANSKEPFKGHGTGIVFFSQEYEIPTGIQIIP